MPGDRAGRQPPEMSDNMLFSLIFNPGVALWWQKKRQEA